MNKCKNQYDTENYEKKNKKKQNMSKMKKKIQSAIGQQRNRGLKVVHLLCVTVDNLRWNVDIRIKMIERKLCSNNTSDNNTSRDR